VDDDPEVTYLLAQTLQPWGYVVLEANSAAEAMWIAREETTDVALIDVRMPDEDGFGVLQALKEQDEHLVAVMMTGSATLEGARRAMRLGAYDYITKPFEIEALRAILEAGLEESAHAPTPPKRLRRLAKADRTRRPREQVASAAVLTTPDR